jgi:S1/P1 nuclease
MTVNGLSTEYEQYPKALALPPSQLLLGLCLLLSACSPAFGWGHEGHTVVALIAEKYMRQGALAKGDDLLDGVAIDSIASWADDYRRDHPETGPWHYIDIPLADSKIDLARECPNKSAVCERAAQPAILGSRRRSRGLRCEAMKSLDRSRLFLQRPGYPCRTVT